MRLPSPTLTRLQARDLDRWAIEQLGIPGIVLMENAAAAAERAVADHLAGQAPGIILIFCGPGNNGGDGLALARRLRNRAFDVRIITTQPAKRFQGDAAINFGICAKMEIPIDQWPARDLPTPQLIVDALVGTGLDREPKHTVAEAIDYINRIHGRGVRVVSIDVPSGLDCDTGEALGSAVRADQTITLAAMKTGFTNPASRDYTGEIIVGDIGIPIELPAQDAAEP